MINMLPNEFEPRQTRNKLDQMNRPSNKDFANSVYDSNISENLCGYNPNEKCMAFTSKCPNLNCPRYNNYTSITADY